MIVIADILDRIPEQQRLIVFYSSSLAIDNGFYGGRVCCLGKEAARTGSMVIIVVPTKDQRVKLQILFDQYVIHAYLAHFSDVLTYLARRYGNLNVFISSGSADINAFSAIQRLHSCGWCTLYDMSYDLEDMHRLKLMSAYNFQVEAAIARLVEGIVAVSSELYEKARSFGVDRKIALIPNATVLRSTKKSLGKKNNCNCNRKARSQPDIVGYFGNLNPVWFDWPSIVKVARELPAVQFELIGDGVPEGLYLPENIRIFESKKYKKNISNWSIGVLPLRRTPLSMSTDPIVVYECLSMGLAVVASPEGSMKHKPNVFIYDGSAIALLNIVKMALKGDLRFKDSGNTKEVADWGYRATALKEFIDEIVT